MKTTLKAATAAILVATAGLPAIVPNVAHATGIPVFDGAAAANFLQQMMRLKEQLDTMRSQLSQAEQMYESVTGSRGFGDVMRNSQLRQYLPDDMVSVYDSVNGGGYAGISGAIDDILDAEGFDGSIDDMQDHIVQRSRNAAATDKAMGLRAYEGAQARLDQIEALMNQISATQDQKGIDELQARIAGEQAAIQNEMTKLQMISQLQAAEQRLVAEQRREMNRRILSSDNTAMPGIN
ncbi:P-type DNA transfer protein VirB5 [Pokkaliibacter sp. MBI-7]|uniref:P-type DNA transfer protein VirB5 n=1 Tax=Pokkaliibacter sp. MBI-7 TaxID=3040600 RepID=UPI0024485BC3|nr:P-type DNA transfer protein VirB5 [Pokkaliibacter sp. MBI-7]MDH2436866.1 P-type DNA transfer protein VirB5 [Pokkaliibacter sp. MBI-7]